MKIFLSVPDCEVMYNYCPLCQLDLDTASNFAKVWKKLQTFGVVAIYLSLHIPYAWT